MSGGGNIKVVVRCRPLNARELARGARGLIRMEGNRTIIDPPEQAGPSSARATEKKSMPFSFDKSYWSAGSREDPNYASQQTLYEDLGVELLDHSFEGFNTCIFAYGQTGSGKSYSMMGYGADKGIIPLTTSELFRRIDERTSIDQCLSYTVEVSYIEIYNEKVRDLLNPKNKGNLKVREHPSLGPYVEDLSKLLVENYGQMMTLMDEGNKARTVASTNMNETSSRSHAVFTVILTQKRHDSQSNMTGEKVSKISLVDLAGSERQASTGATGTRLKEGANINKSLTTLGKVIAALAQASGEQGKGRKRKDDFVPYRDSALTWLLKESLGGNSKTAMIAAISPADYEETLSTLRYADAAKKIKTHAVVNEDPNAKLIRELKEELELLRSRVSTGSGVDEADFDPLIPPDKQIVTYRTKEGEIKKVTQLELQDQLQASEKLMDSLNLTWEEKMAKTQMIHVEREKALEELGISIDKDMVGVHAPQKHPSLVNLNEDPLMSELKSGQTIAGSLDNENAHIKLSGLNILPKHCIFTNKDGVVTVQTTSEARTFVNGKRATTSDPIKLLNGFRVILGDFHVFRFNDPAAVRAERQKMQTSTSIDSLTGVNGTLGHYAESPGSRAEGELMDWSAARREVADIERLGDQDLDRLFDDILKVRSQRGRPDSRYDMAAELESRLLTASQTAETLEPESDTRGAGQATTMTSNSTGTPLALEDDSADLDFGVETIAIRSHADSSSVYDEETANTARRQAHMVRQLRAMANEVRRMKAQAVAARVRGEPTGEPVNWSPREFKLAQHTIDCWKRLRWYTLAEEVLTGAVDVREANAIARKIKQDVSYNFLIVDAFLSSPSSSLDKDNGIIDFEEVSNTLPTSGSGPMAVVKVSDRRAEAVYTWDLPRFKRQLSKMRHALTLRERPNYSVHFRTEDSFTDIPPSTYSLIATATASLRLLLGRFSYSAIVPVMCRYTMEAIGSCRVTLKCEDAASSGLATPESGWKPSTDGLKTGSKLSFALSVDNVKRLCSNDFASVHIQTRLSSLVGSSVAHDDILASTAIDLDKVSSIYLTLKRPVSIIVTPDIISHFRHNYLTVEFYARVRPNYLDRLDWWDRSRDVSPSSTPQGTPLKIGDVRPAMRRCETDFIGAQQHDVLANIEVRQLASNGEYVPAEVNDGVFELHQGLQRRLNIKLTHTSGSTLPWKGLQLVNTSNIRVVDKAGRISIVSKPSVELRMNEQVVHVAADGTSTLSVSGVWDTAAHACRQLDRRTASDQYLLIRLSWLLEVDSLDEPAVFHLDLPIRVLGRDSRRSSILNFFNSAKVYHSATSTFTIDLNPPLARSAGDLWRLNTAKKHVVGEELLGDWQPRSLTVIEDYRRMKRAATVQADVQATKCVLDYIGEIDQPSKTQSAESSQLMERCVALWKIAMDHRVTIDVQRENAESEAVSRSVRRLIPELQPKLVPSVQLQAVTETIIKSGVMMLLSDSQADRWIKRFFALRRPYLLVHESSTEREYMVINLCKAHVQLSPDVQMLLGRRWAFTIFTPTNSYVLQASSEKELREWMSVISATVEA